MIAKHIGKRLLIGLLTIFVASVVSFILVHLMPGSPGVVVMGQGGTPEEIRAFNESIGWYKPWTEQYFNWAINVMHGDFGISFVDKVPVSDGLSARFAVTAALAVFGVLVSSIIGIFAGVLAATRGGWLDRVLNSGSNIFFAVPGYWLAIFLVLIFAVNNPLLPATGFTAFQDDPVAWAQSLVLPVLALAIPSGAGLARSTRAAMFDAFSQEHNRTLRAMGEPKWRLIYVHALRFASVQIVAMIGMNFVLTFGGTVMIEQLFVLPGLGDSVQGAVAATNAPVLQAVVLVTTIVVVLTNLVTEIAIMYLNPKVRTR